MIPHLANESDAAISRQTAPEASQNYRLSPTAYDRVASLVVSLLILVGATVLILLAVWLTSRFAPKQIAVPVVMQKIGDDAGFGDRSELDLSIEDPGVETEFDEPDLERSLASIADAVATQIAILDDHTIWDDSATGRGKPGDGRRPGDGRGEPGIRRRWEVRFVDGHTLQTYAEQLDFFGIELGVLQSGGRVAYAFNLSQAKPSTRVGPAEQEQRYYLTWDKGSLEEGDRELLRRAGIAAEDRPILKFLPPTLEGQLAALEQQAAGENKDRVRATYFGVRRIQRGYEFHVVDQTFGY